MRLKVFHSREPRHTDVVSAVGWTSSEEVYSCGDDHRVLRWHLANMEASTLTELPQSVFPTASESSSKKGSKTDTILVAATDGKIHILNRQGKIEKAVDAHRGAVLCLRLSPDATAILSCGEDGCVKMWSRNGLLRSVVAQFSTPVYAAAWDESSSRIVYCNAEYCHLKSLKTQTAVLRWKAHDGLLLCCDWSSNSDLIVTGSEDCKYKVWDSFGRVLFTSTTHEFPITSVSWSPDGALFAVGSHNILRLCDRAGWSHSLEKLSTGSVLGLSWSPDGTQVIAGSASGHLVHAHITEKRVSYHGFEAVQTKHNLVEIRDVSSDTSKERLETRDRVTRISIGFGYLIVVTTTQIYIFNSKNWNTPVICELKEKAVSMVIQCEKIFLIADGNGIYVFNIEGRHLCDLKLPNNAVGCIGELTTVMANDTVAILDRNDRKLIHLLDPLTSKPQGDTQIKHEHELLELAISQTGPIIERMVAMRDSGGAVLLAMVKTYGSIDKIAKLGSLVEHLLFNDISPMLAGVADGRLVVWPLPSIVFHDRNLLQYAVIEKPVTALGKFPRLISFTGNTVVLRRSDGSEVPVGLTPFTASLISAAGTSQWDQSIRICRMLKDETLWSMLAGLAIKAKNLYAAEIAYGALDEGEKVQFLSEARNHTDKLVREAMLVMITGKVSEAESILEKNGYVFRAVMLNLTMCRWERALELAVKHKKLLEVVIGYRQRYLEQLGTKETIAKFLELAGEVEIDWEHITETIENEQESERKR